MLRGFFGVLILAGLVACGNDDSGSPNKPPDAAADATPDTSSGHSLTLELQRVKPGTEIRAVVTVDAGVTGVSIESSRGIVSAVTQQTDGSYLATVTPNGTGEYVLTAHAADAADVSRTAVVLSQVGDRWGQPQAFRGPVNTPAWEDSLAISPDAEWLVLEYLPVSITCLLEHASEPDHSSCSKAIGPWQAPERPGMAGAERIAADGTIHNGCPSLGLDPAPFSVPPQALFGFKRQEDGSYAQPFAITIDGADGCVSAFGASMLAPSGSSVPMLFAFDTPTDGDPPVGTQGDIFFTDLALGTPSALATFSGGAFDMHATLLGFSPAGHQGNPHYFVGSGGTQVWVDDESAAEEKLSVYELTGTFPAGPWTGPTPLPGPFSEAGHADIQPYFDGNEALWTRDLGIVSSQRSGPVTDAASWTATAVELASLDAASTEPGAIIGVGEPTKAVRAGHEVLAFVYVMRAPNGELDINAGFVEAD